MAYSHGSGRTRTRSWARSLLWFSQALTEALVSSLPYIGAALLALVLAAILQHFLWPLLGVPTTSMVGLLMLSGMS